MAETGQGTVCEMVCVSPVLYRVYEHLSFSNFFVALLHSEIANQLCVVSKAELVSCVIC